MNGGFTKDIQVIERQKYGQQDKPVVRLRAATYLSPSIPIEYFEIIIEYLKTRLGYVDTSLRYESNCENLEKIFDNNEVDIAWITGLSHIRLSSKGKASLLPVASVHSHPKADGRPGYYSDVIIHKSLGSRVTSFEDLRGCKWAYISVPSLSGNITTLLHLKRMGENAAFFGLTTPALTHLQCIHMVLHRQADATAVDSNCLQIFLDRNPQYRNDLQVVSSFGPLPPYPIVINKNMPKELSSQITEALLQMHTHPKWSLRLAKYRVRKFAAVDEDEVTAWEKELVMSAKDLNFDVRYY